MDLDTGELCSYPAPPYVETVASGALCNGVVRRVPEEVMPTIHDRFMIRIMQDVLGVVLRACVVWCACACARALFN